MNIKLKSVRLKNFMSFADSIVNFNQKGYTIISGTNLNTDDNAASNGSGKSSIFEGIVWNLTGETMRGTKDVKRYNSSDKCEVELEFDIDKNNYKIVRTKDPANLFIYINNEDKSGKGIRDSQKLLEEYLPDITAQLIGSVIIMGQGLPMRFSNNTPSGRKDVLEKLSRSDFMIDDLKDKVSNRKLILNNEKRKSEDLILTNNTLINSKTAENIRFEAELKTLNNIEYDSIIEDKTKLITEYSTNQKNIQSQIDTLKESYDLLYKQSNKTANDKYNESIAINNKYEPLIKAQNELYTKAISEEAVLKNKLNNIKNIKTHCPTCGQALKNVEKPDPAPIEQELLNQSKVTKDINAKLVELNSNKKEELTTISNKYSEVEKKQQSDLNLKQVEIRNLTSKLNGYINQINSVNTELNSIKLQKQNHEYKVEQLNINIKLNVDQINKATLKNQEEDKKLINNKLHLDIINKFETALKRDFRGVLLNNIINYIDSKAKEYSQIVFGTNKLDFKLNGNNINILYDNKDYANLSGGERQKIDLIIQFALRDMLCKYLNFSSNILVLDEIVDNLDSIGCQKVMELISSRLNDVDSIYIISHHADIPMPIDYELNIIKDKDGISSVRNN